MSTMLKKPKAATLSLIAAMDKNRVIGQKNKLPWHLSADLQHFKRLTMGKPIVMGRKTYESIGRPLPGRRNIVLSREKNLFEMVEGLEIFSSLEEAFQALCDVKEIMIIGGGKIFEQTIGLADHLYLTIIDHTFDGDVFFPEYQAKEWHLALDDSFPADEKNPYAYRFQEWVRLK